MFTNHIYSLYMYEGDLALNNLQLLIYHKTKSKTNIFVEIVPWFFFFFGKCSFFFFSFYLLFTHLFALGYIISSIPTKTND